MQSSCADEVRVHPEYLDAEDEKDQIKATVVGMFLNNAEYLMPQERNGSPRPTKCIYEPTATPDNAKTSMCIPEAVNRASSSHGIHLTVPGQSDTLLEVEETLLTGNGE